MHNLSCWVKSYDRKTSTLNGYMWGKRTIDKPHLDGSLYYKYGTIFREVIKFPRFNVCEVNRIFMTNKLLEQTYIIIKHIVPHLIHECPYWGVEAYNVTVRTKDEVYMFPQGDYKFTVFLWETVTGPLIAKRTYNSPYEFWVNFKSVKCEGTEYGIEKYMHNLSCWVKSYDRKTSTLNGYMWGKRTIDKPHLDGSLYYKYGTIFREVIKFPRFNVCEVNRIFMTNKLFEQTYIIIKHIVPHLIHECPYWGVEAYNVTVRTKDEIYMFPQGDYKVTIFLFETEIGPLVGNATLIVTIYSPYKDSFGKK
ncbi:hypothetical protein PVAND_016609 [Polypedilum vanderplanki]|nr:hypothetical protein PVAND_016609 [Polypedilum vanderplanki]